MDQGIMITNQETENSGLNMRLAELENKIRNYESKEDGKELPGNDLQSKSQIQGGYITEEIEASINDSDHEAKKRTDDKKVASSISKRIVKMNSDNIAFHVYLTGWKCVLDQQLVVFDTEVIDEGNGYNSADGIYVVPESGIYVFTWTVFSVINEWLSADIIVDGISRGRLVSDGNNDQATGTILAYVNVGSHVFIKKTAGDGCIITDDISSTTFTGWKLF